MDPGESFIGTRLEPEAKAVRPIVVALTCVIGIAIAGIADYVTGYELRVYPLYYIPIAWGAIHLRRGWVAMLALASAAAWLAANGFGGAWAEASWVWVFNFVAQVISFGLVGGLIAELRRRLRIEQSLARVDPLTKLLNKRAFREQASLLLALAHRTRAPLTVAYLDLDDFKRVNDEHGHDQGDQALTLTASILRDNCRAGDVIARVGGDEFALILTNTDSEGSLALLERLRETLSAAMVEHRWPVSVSVGALCYRSAPPTLDEALHAADELMYRAKRGGKNRVHVENA